MDRAPNACFTVTATNTYYVLSCCAGFGGGNFGGNDMGRGNGGGVNFANDGFGMEGGMGFSGGGGGDYLVKMRGLPFSATPADIADVSLCQLSHLSANIVGCFLILMILV